MSVQQKSCRLWGGPGRASHPRRSGVLCKAPECAHRVDELCTWVDPAVPEGAPGRRHHVPTRTDGHRTGAARGPSHRLEPCPPPDNRRTPSSSARSSSTSRSCGRASACSPPPTRSGSTSGLRGKTGAVRHSTLGRPVLRQDISGPHLKLGVAGALRWGLLPVDRQRGEVPGEQAASTSAPHSGAADKGGQRRSGPADPVHSIPAAGHGKGGPSGRRYRPRNEDP